MANDEIIRSFLVSLGWKNDTTSERRFIGAIEDCEAAEAI
jgi:hypothetical protein